MSERGKNNKVFVVGARLASNTKSISMYIPSFTRYMYKYPAIITMMYVHVFIDM
jgi:hypothetical protein